MGLQTPQNGRCLVTLLLLMTAKTSRGGVLDPDDGTCPLTLFLPFTTTTVNNIKLLTQDPKTLVSHMAAVVMAMNHFNARDASVVPELADDAYSTCNVTFPTSALVIHDTETIGSTAMAALLGDVFEFDRRPCAIIGPWYDKPTVELSVATAALDIPVVTHGATTRLLSTPRASMAPLTTRTIAHAHGIADAIVDYLFHLNRTNYICVMSGIKEWDLDFQRTLASSAKSANFTNITSTNVNHGAKWRQEGPGSLAYEMEQLKKTSYRTIFVGLNELNRLQAIADVAERLEMNGEDYVWFIFSPSMTLLDELGSQVDGSPSANRNLTRLLHGSGTIRPIDGFAWDKNDRFLRSWKSQGTDVVDQVNLVNPMLPRGDDVNPTQFSYVVPDDYFEIEEPRYGAGFAYDAVIAVGLGACIAQKTAPQSDTPGKRTAGVGKEKDLSTPGMQLFNGILGSHFTGATGKNSRSKGRNRKKGKNRLRTSVVYGVYNFRSVNQSNGSTVLTEVFLNDNFWEGKKWTEVDGEKFMFADGTAVSPLLRDPPIDNYLSEWARAVGLALMAVSLSQSSFFTSFVVYHRERTVVKASQPFFLILLCGGAVLMAFSILTLSFDESHGISERGLDALCQITPWLFVLGYITVYSALICKLWRVHKLLQFRRRKVSTSKVVMPFGILLLLSVIVLVAWNAVDPWTWHRDIIDYDTGESYGQCRSPHSLYFFVALALLMGCATLMAFLMAWKTKDVDDTLAESTWIFYTIYAQVQAMVVGFPILVLLNQVSVDATYLGRVLLIFTLSVTSVTFVICPKVVKLHFREASGRQAKRGASVGRRIEGNRTNVTGLSGSSNRDTNGHGDSPKRKGLRNSFQRLSMSFNAETAEILALAAAKDCTSPEVDVSSVVAPDSFPKTVSFNPEGSVRRADSALTLSRGENDEAIPKIAQADEELQGDLVVESKASRREEVDSKKCQPCSQAEESDACLGRREAQFTPQTTRRHQGDDEGGLHDGTRVEDFFAGVHRHYPVEGPTGSHSIPSGS